MWRDCRGAARLVRSDDAQQRALDRAGHLRGIAAHVEVAALLQQAPHQRAALPQPVLHVHLVRLRRPPPGSGGQQWAVHASL